MKKILLATTMLAASAGFASAEVALSGDAYMGLYRDFGGETVFASQARVIFTLSGETDGGLQFGASFRADNAGGAHDGTAGSVYISGAFGKLSMGDVDSAAGAAIGQVSYVGMTSLGSLNEILYIGTGGKNLGSGSVTSDPSVLYAYNAGDITAYASATNPSGDADAYGLAVKYATGAYSVGLAYESADLLSGVNLTQISLGGSATFGAATVKAVVSQMDTPLGNLSEYALSVDYKVNALTVTAFYQDSEDLLLTPLAQYGSNAYGVGAAYDLGGGASVKGGYVYNNTTSEDSFDLGVVISF